MKFKNCKIRYVVIIARVKCCGITIRKYYGVGRDNKEAYIEVNNRIQLRDAGNAEYTIHRMFIDPKGRPREYESSSMSQTFDDMEYFYNEYWKHNLCLHEIPNKG